jgi:hypothetical protein
MSIRLRKVIYQVFMDELDEEGRTVDELNTQNFGILWPHQLESLPDRVLDAVRAAESQAAGRNGRAP